MQQLIKASAIDNAIAVEPVTIPLPAAGTGLHCNTVEKSTPRPQTTVTVSPYVQIVTVKTNKSMSLDAILGTLRVVKYAVKGDGSCLYHAISHQAGLISNTS